MSELLGDTEVTGSAPRLTGTGALLAVCSLCGGAGASTLAYLIGAAAATSDAPVLVCDGAEPTAGLSAYASLESLRSFEELASELAQGQPVGEGLFAEPRAGLRLIATAPRVNEQSNPVAIARLLADARDEHRLTIVDCGRLATAVGQVARQHASHVAWVLPATVSGVLRARRVLGVYEPDSSQRELVVARADSGRRQAPMAELTALAEARRAPLVLMPHVPDLGEHTCEQGLEAAAVTLEAIRSVVRR